MDLLPKGRIRTGKGIGYTDFSWMGRGGALTVPERYRGFSGQRKQNFPMPFRGIQVNRGRFFGLSGRTSGQQTERIRRNFSVHFSSGIRAEKIPLVGAGQCMG